MKAYDIIIIGAGIAGIRVAEQARKVSAQASIAIISEEDRLPYKRTQLSKNLAKGFEKEDFALYTDDWYQNLRLDLYTGQKVTSISEQYLLTEQGLSLTWKRLVLSTGAKSYIPSEFKNRKYYQVYFASDAEKLFHVSKGRSLVIGMGVLGVETADQLWRMGHEVTVAGLDSRLMIKQLNSEASKHLQSTMKNNGIHFRFSGKVENPDEFDNLILCTGSSIRKDIDLTLEYDHGYLVNQYLQTSFPKIFAAGDGARMQGSYQSHLWHAAEHSGIFAGRNVALSLIDNSLMKPYLPLAWRLKCEVFNQYYFSINYSSNFKDADYDIIEEKWEDSYRCFYFLNNKIYCIIMINEKYRAKWYQKAVQDGMQKDDFIEAVNSSFPY